MRRRDRASARGRRGIPSRRLSASVAPAEGMGDEPMPRDVDAPRDPDPLVPLGIIDKPFERGGATGPPGEPAVQANRHHARARFALAIKYVEGVPQIGKELVSRVEPLRGGETHVI